MNNIINVPLLTVGVNNIPSTIDAQAKNAILNFLKELEIQKIIYVDDRCSIQELKESFIGKLKSIYQEKPDEIDFVNWTSPLPVFEREINSTWDNSDDDERRKIYLKILKYQKDDEDIVNSIAPLRLKDLLKDKIDLLSPNEWDTQKNTITQALSNHFKILFLFDIEFQHAPLSDGRNGKDLVAELLSRTEINDFVYCGIFSHLFDINEEFEKRNEFSISHSLQKDRFYTISKKRFQDDSFLPGLAEGIKNTLLINEVELLKKEASAIIKKSFAKTVKDINDLSPDTFNHIIQRSSKNEGVWEMETLFRLTNIIGADKALESLLPEKNRIIINAGLGKIRKIENIKTGSETPFNKKQVNKLRKKELFLSSSILNKLHFPISNGDIFLIENKEYILLAQPCNLELRSSGERGNNYRTGFLLEIQIQTKEDCNKMGKAQYGIIGVIEDPDLEDNKNKIVKFPFFKTVDLSPLDLTVFNQDGISKIDLKVIEDNSLILQESWKKKYKKLHQEFTRYQNGVLVFKKLKTARKGELKKYVYNGELFKGYNINNETAFSRSGDKLVFKIKRISHYHAPYSSDLLQKFMQYLSRNAFNHDFSNR